jgi:hypothetical protein
MLPMTMVIVNCTEEAIASFDEAMSHLNRVHRIAVSEGVLPNPMQINHLGRVCSDLHTLVQFMRDLHHMRREELQG